MSLQVWLPLTGVLKNQGLYDVEVFNENSTVDDNGKIGKCYSFNGSSSRIYTNPVSLNSTQLSISVWFNRSSNTTSEGYIASLNNGSGYSDCAIGLDTSNATTLVFAGGGKASLSVKFTSDEWHHAVVTFDGTTVMGYLDGEKKGSFTATPLTKTLLTIGARANSTQGAKTAIAYPFNGKLNDFRLYDHALSQKEVKELSKGLCLHYKLNASGGINNLTRNQTYKIYNNYGVPASLVKLDETFQGCDVYRLTMTPTSNSLSHFQSTITSHGIMGFTRTFLANTKYCFWICYRPVTHNDVRVGGVASNIGGWTEIPPAYYRNGWYRVGQYRTGTVTTNKQDSIFTSFRCPSAIVDEPISIDFCCPHLVEGYNYILEELDYQSVPDDVEYDCSGFGYDGIKINEMVSVNGSPRYSTDLKFTGGYITCDTAFNTLNSTLSVWIKAPLTGNSFVIDGRNSSGIGKQPIYSYTDGSIQSGGNTTYIKTNQGFVDKNQWTHIAVVQNADQCLFYKNGELFQTINCTNSPLIQPTLCARYTYTSPFDGELSDFRLYTTALSAEDILELYHTSALIDNNSNAYSYEYIED